MERVVGSEPADGRRSLIIKAAAWTIGAGAAGLAAAIGVLAVTDALDEHRWTIIGCLLGIAALMMTSAMIGTSVALRGVREMIGMLDRLGDGDLTAQIKVVSSDEIGALGETHGLTGRGSRQPKHAILGTAFDRRLGRSPVMSRRVRIWLLALLTAATSATAVAVATAAQAGIQGSGH